MKYYEIIYFRNKKKKWQNINNDYKFRFCLYDQNYMTYTFFFGGFQSVTLTRNAYSWAPL